ncbi:MAG TPA: hypothetical protein VG742_17765 [Dongiaceae bacterium]|nr:hypothetical protein [Dongiaceae bacterium]
MVPRRQTIPVFLQVKTALQILWQQRDDALRLGLIPTLIGFGGFLYGQEALVVMYNLMLTGIPVEPPPGVAGPIFVAGLASLVATCLLMVNWLRFLLLGPMGAVGIGLSIGAPHVRFFFTVIGFVLATTILLMVLMQPMVLLPPALATIGVLVVIAMVLILLARLAPFLVGKAIGQSMSLKQSWNVSRGNGASVAVSLILVQVPFMIGFTLLEMVLRAIGFMDLAPIGTVFIGIIGQFAMLICQASILATAYRHMVGVRV